MHWPRTAREAERLRQNLRIAWGILVSLATAWAAIVGALITQDVVKWSPYTALVPLVAASIVSIIQTGAGAQRQHNQRAGMEHHDSLRQLVASGVKQISKLTQVPLEAIGACIWEVQSYRPILWNARLTRRVRFRVDSFPPPSEDRKSTRLNSSHWE